MTEITKERRDAIRAAAMKATPGPWETTVAYGNSEDDVWVQITAPDYDAVVAKFQEDTNDIPHIANCDPQTILALLDALDAAEAKMGAEPVAWKHVWLGLLSAQEHVSLSVSRPEERENTVRIEPLYAAPPAAEPVIPEGWVLVPREPTEAMIELAAKAFDPFSFHSWKQSYEYEMDKSGDKEEAKAFAEWSMGKRLAEVRSGARSALKAALTTSPEPSHE